MVICYSLRGRCFAADLGRPYTVTLEENCSLSIVCWIICAINDYEEGQFKELDSSYRTLSLRTLS